MTDLSDPAIREAGARALYASDGFSDSAREYFKHEWDSSRTLDEPSKDLYRRRWDNIATELGPIIAMTAVREQMRGGIDDAGNEDSPPPPPPPPSTEE